MATSSSRGRSERRAAGARLPDLRSLDTPLRMLAAARRPTPMLYLELTGLEHVPPHQSREAPYHSKRAVAAAMRDCLGTALRSGDVLAAGPGGRWFVALLAGRSVHAPARGSVRDADLGLIAGRLQSAVRARLAEAVRAKILPRGVGAIGGWTVLDPVSPAKPLRELRQAVRGAAVVARVEAQRAAVLAAVTHELRTPLTSIIGYAERLCDDPRMAAGRRARYGRVIAEEGSRLHRLVEGLIDVGAWQAGRLTLSRRPTDLRALLRAAWRPIAATAHAKSVRLVVRGSGRASVDRDRLQQVFINLFDNAVRYSPEGGCISAGIGARGRRCRVAIADQGEGLRPALRLGRPFTPGATGRAGLGLSIAELLVRAHGGELTIARRRGRTVASVLLLSQNSQDGVPPKEFRFGNSEN